MREFEVEVGGGRTRTAYEWTDGRGHRWALWKGDSGRRFFANRRWDRIIRYRDGTYEGDVFVGNARIYATIHCETYEEARGLLEKFYRRTGRYPANTSCVDTSEWF